MFGQESSSTTKRSTQEIQFSPGHVQDARGWGLLDYSAESVDSEEFKDLIISENKIEAGLLLLAQELVNCYFFVEGMEFFLIDLEEQTKDLNMENITNAMDVMLRFKTIMDKGVKNAISIDECFNFIQSADKASRETFGTSLFEGKSEIDTLKIQKHLSDIIWNLIRIGIILTDENKRKIDEGWNQALARVDAFIETAQ